MSSETSPETGRQKEERRRKVVAWAWMGSGLLHAAFLLLLWAYPPPPKPEREVLLEVDLKKDIPLPTPTAAAKPTPKPVPTPRRIIVRPKPRMVKPRPVATRPRPLPTPPRPVPTRPKPIATPPKPQPTVARPTAIPPTPVPAPTQVPTPVPTPPQVPKRPPSRSTAQVPMPQATAVARPNPGSRPDAAPAPAPRSARRTFDNSSLEPFTGARSQPAPDSPAPSSSQTPSRSPDEAPATNNPQRMAGLPGSGRTRRHMDDSDPFGSPGPSTGAAEPSNNAGPAGPVGRRVASTNFGSERDMAGFGRGSGLPNTGTVPAAGPPGRDVETAGGGGSGGGGGNGGRRGRGGRGGTRLAGDPFGFGGGGGNGGSGGQGGGNGPGGGGNSGRPGGPGGGGRRYAMGGPGGLGNGGEGDGPGGGGNFGRGTGLGGPGGTGSGGNGTGGKGEAPSGRGNGTGDDTAGAGSGSRGRITRARTASEQEGEDEIGRGIWGGFKMRFYQDVADHPDVPDATFHPGNPIDWAVFTKLMATVKKPNLNFDWGTDPPAAGMKSTFWSMKASGKIFVPKDDTYEFFFDELDDAGSLTLDGKEIIRIWKVQKSSPSSGKMFLTRGPHDLDIEYVQGPATAASIRLSWKSTSFGKEIVGVYKGAG